jgi:hypothetical protein
VEEKALIDMFGNDYLEFRKTTPIRIPFMAKRVDAALRKRSVIGPTSSSSPPS